MASNQERLAVCDAMVSCLQTGKLPPAREQCLTIMREIRDIYASIVAKHNAKNAGPVKKHIDPRDLAQAMWEDIRR